MRVASPPASTTHCIRCCTLARWCTARAMIKIAVVGAGHWGPNLIRNFHNGTTSQVRWIVDADAKRLDTARSRFPDVQVTSEVAQAFNDKEVTAVVIATPTSTHYPLAKAALEAGKHVFFDDPATTETRQG